LGGEAQAGLDKEEKPQRLTNKQPRKKKFLKEIDSQEVHSLQRKKVPRRHENTKRAMQNKKKRQVENLKKGKKKQARPSFTGKDG